MYHNVTKRNYFLNRVRLQYYSVRQHPTRRSDITIFRVWGTICCFEKINKRQLQVQCDILIWIQSKIMLIDFDKRCWDKQNVLNFLFLNLSENIFSVFFLYKYGHPNLHTHTNWQIINYEFTHKLRINTCTNYLKIHTHLLKHTHTCRNFMQSGFVKSPPPPSWDLKPTAATGNKNNITLLL